MISSVLSTPASTGLIGSRGTRRPADVSLEKGLDDIRRTDPGFDPSRFRGYAGMLFRAAQDAWVARDMGPLRDRVTAELHDVLQAHCQRWRSSRRVNRLDEVEVVAVVTEAWQEDGRDYVTAHITGSVLDYVVDEEGETVLEGSRTMPRGVDELWTFRRPAGLNFWMLSGIKLAG